jgi:hypothetical protein
LNADESSILFFKDRHMADIPGTSGPDTLDGTSENDSITGEARGIAFGTDCAVIRACF